MSKNTTRIILLLLIFAGIGAALLYTYSPQFNSRLRESDDPRSPFPTIDYGREDSNTSPDEIDVSQPVGVDPLFVKPTIIQISTQPTAGLVTLDYIHAEVPTLPIELPLLAEGDTSDQQSAQTPETFQNASLAVRYALKANAFIFDANINPNTHEFTTIQKTDSFIPKIHEAIFSPNGNRAYLRFYNQDTQSISTFAGVLPNTADLDTACVDTVFDITVSQGDRGPEVASMQAILGELLDQDVEVDGIYGSGTAALVSDFQAQNNLAQTGQIDIDTLLEFELKCADIAADAQLFNLSQSTNLDGRFISGDTTLFDVAPDGSRLVVGNTTSDDEFAIATTNPDGDDAKLLFKSPFSEWLLDWHSTESITLATKPSGLFASTIFTINANDQPVLRKHINAGTGRTALVNPQQTYSLVSNVQSDGIINTEIFNHITNTETSLGAAAGTVVDQKCVWATETISYCAIPTNQVADTIMPDIWYQGAYNFNDALYKIDAIAGTVELVENLPNLDLINLTYHPLGYVAGIDKTTSTAWLIAVTEQSRS